MVVDEKGKEGITPGHSHPGERRNEECCREKRLNRNVYKPVLESSKREEKKV